MNPFEASSAHTAEYKVLAETHDMSTVHDYLLWVVVVLGVVVVVLQ